MFRSCWMIRLLMTTMTVTANKVRFRTQLRRTPFMMSFFLPFFIALWPLFHYLLWQDVSPNSLSASFSADEHWAPYEQANAAFARRILDVYRPGDLVWVHDYHLLLVPKLLRLMLPEVCVGLFVHTPWPSSEVFRCLPRMYTKNLYKFRRSHAYIFSFIRAEGNTRWHARRQYCMLPNLLILASLHVILRASMWL